MCYQMRPSAALPLNKMAATEIYSLFEKCYTGGSMKNILATI